MNNISPQLTRNALLQKISKGDISQLLYKYRGDNENTEKIFIEHTLWFEHPNKFNDPFDCWTNIQSVDYEGISKIIEQIQMPDALRNLCEQGIPQYTKEMHKNGIDIVFNRIGICCFSKKCNQILMWSHYADYHKGICLQFDILEDPSFFNFIFPVTYVDAMPEFHYPTDFINMLDKTIKPKSDLWKYEEEVRVVKTNREIKENNGQTFRFHPEALTKVIFGCKATQTTIEKYKRLCNVKEFKHVKFSKMEQMRDGTFGLIEKDI